jgi:DNA-binding transcriptional MerR regulator
MGPPTISLSALWRNIYMKKRRLRIRDIAEETGISEQTVRAYVQEFGDLLPSQAVGRVKLYDEPAVHLIQKIDTLASEGSSPEEITRALHRKSPPRSRAGTHPRKTPPLQQGTAPGAPNTAKAPPPPPGNHLRALRDTIALQEQQIKAIHRRLEGMNSADNRLDEEIAGIRAHLDEVEAAHARQVEIIEQWIAYFDRRLDMYEASAKASTEQVRAWIEYLEDGLEKANAPLMEKILRRFG